MRWVVEEFYAGKWWPVRSFDNEEDAVAFAKWGGYKYRVKKPKRK